MSAEAINALVAAVGGFLLGWNPWARRDSKRLDWLLLHQMATWEAGSVVTVYRSRDSIDAAMAAEAAHDAH